MPNIEIINKENKKAGKTELPEDIFSAEIKKGLIHGQVTK